MVRCSFVLLVAVAAMMAVPGHSVPMGSSIGGYGSYSAPTTTTKEYYTTKAAEYYTTKKLSII
ncbi:Uncharacterized protein APZ42_004779 [Daphnia magna]|uniref:Uncharacterized protein n=1 Tax=Daphnia magna TaxID=35525 RepID=A0A164GUK8_9CRUS|nr:Uncharacterized protein APZ42_004779 [Daphnia magna]